ncbi:MAG: A24 family peptidase [Caulobacteraceae bacterium]
MTAWRAFALLAAVPIAQYATSAARRFSASLASVEPSAHRLEPARPGIWVTAFVSAALLTAVWFAPSDAGSGAILVFFGGLAYLAMTDMAALLIPIWPARLLILGGLAAQGLSGWPQVLVHALAAGGGWALFRGLEFAYLRWRGRLGLGSGDALIAAAIGAWLGPAGLAWSVCTGCAATLLVNLIAFGWSSTRPMPLAPGLAIGAFAAFLGQSLLGNTW